MNKPSKDMITPDQPSDDLSRRNILSILSVALGALIAAIAGIPVVGFVFGRMLRKPKELWRPVGTADSFKIGATVAVKFDNASSFPWDGVAAHTGAWLRRISDQEFIAFSLNCTHLGCPVEWEPKADLFMCPCHGGVYYSDGAVAGGPPPKPLPRYQVRVQKGKVEIQTAPIPMPILAQAEKSSGCRCGCDGGCRCGGLA